MQNVHFGLSDQPFKLMFCINNDCIHTLKFLASEPLTSLFPGSTEPPEVQSIGFERE